MAEDDALRLAELLCARLCHDLAGPVGAVGTGAELLAEEAEDSGQASEALDLLVGSAAAAGTRLRFLRLALGGGTQPVGGRQLAEMAAAYVKDLGGGLALEWREEGGEPWPPVQARLLLNLVLLARDCLPRGGRIGLSARPAAGVLAEVTAAGTGAQPGEAVQALGLSAGGAAAAVPDDLGPRGAQGYYTRALARRLHLAVELRASPGQVFFRIAEDLIPKA